MGLFIQTHLHALNVQRTLYSNTQRFERTHQQRSLKIPIKTSKSSLNRAQPIQQNPSSKMNQNNESLNPSAQETLSKISALLNRIREYAIQASSGPYRTRDHQSLQIKIQNLQDELYSFKEIKENSDLSTYIHPNLIFSPLDITSRRGAKNVILTVDQALKDLLDPSHSVETHFDQNKAYFKNRVKKEPMTQPQVLNQESAAKTAQAVQSLILQDSRISFLAQANQNSQSALLLLG